MFELRGVHAADVALKHTETKAERRGEGETCGVALEFAAVVTLHHTGRAF